MDRGPVAKSGGGGRSRQAKGAGPNPTRQALVDAAVESLRADGFAGASARSIAARAGANQGLVFYYFGSVNDLLLAALDEVSARRLARYSAAVEAVRGPAELATVAAAIFREDLDNGDVKVLVEMIAGAASAPDLGPQVAARIAPWRAFAQQAIEQVVADSPLGALLPAGEAAHAVVALYLGLEMLSELDGDRTAALALFDQIRKLATLFAGTNTPAQPEETR